MLLIITPYYDCGDSDWHYITPKTWIIVFSLISMLQVMKEKVKLRVDQMHRENSINYRTRSRILVGMTILFEIFHFVWQIYGNVIYYNQSSDEKVMKCKDMRNPGLNWILLMLLIFGYLFFVIYVMVIFLVGSLYFRRFNNSRAQRSQSTRILRSIPRMQFSEQLFGAISDENECIICMTPYKDSDTITKLNCNAKHYYHTACIENWIKQGSN